MNPNMFILNKKYLNDLTKEQFEALHKFLYENVSMGMTVGQLTEEMEKIRKPTKKETWYQCTPSLTPKHYNGKGELLNNGTQYWWWEPFEVNINDS